MSVYPDGSKPVPEGVKTVSTAVALQDLTEQKIRDQIRAKHLPPWSNVTNKFSEFASSIFRDVSNAFLGNYTGVNDHLKDFQDGQLALRGRQDLLDNLLNYGSAYSDKAYVDMAANRWHRMPFDRQISTEMRGCEIIPEGGIRLLRKGLWDIRGHVFAGPCAGLLDREVTMEVRVYSPSGSLFSTLQGRVAGKSSLSIPVIASVQVPDANYQVQVWIYSKNYYLRWGYGPTFSRLTVQQISSVDVPTGNEASEEPPLVGEG